MKKIILGLSAVALSVGLLSALDASKKIYASETVSANEQVKELFKDYYNGSSYIKNSSIKFDLANFGELATYFHAGSTVLDRTTYYHGNELWMSRGTESAGYSYYGSAANNGGVTNATAETALVTPANPKVVLTGEGKESMEDYYVTMKDLMVDSFFYEEDTWTTLSEGVYKTVNADIMDKFRLFTAPCFLNYEEDGDKLEHYLTLSKATVTKSGDGLVLSLYVDGTDSGKVVGEADSEGDYLLSQATVSYEADVWDGTTVSTSLQGSGTEADPYLISSGADLKLMEQTVNVNGKTGNNYNENYFKLTNNIDLNGNSISIGTYPGAWGESHFFSGRFDGNNYSIRGLNNSATTMATGLFTSVWWSTIDNLSVYGNVSSTSTYVGGIVGYLGNATISNCNNFVNVSGDSYFVGGVAAYGEKNNGVINNCVNYGTIVGKDAGTGGIVGCNKYNLSNCINYGAVTGKTNTGGILGTDEEAAGSTTNCINYGTVTGSDVQTGGIAGTSISPISSSSNYGFVKGVGSTGGIIGLVNAAITIDSCTNYGEVNATSVSGGIVGKTGSKMAANITNCDNRGIISCTSYQIGGIIGFANTSSIIKNCDNYANVSSSGDYVAGIAGKNSGSISECENNANITGKKYVAGIVATNNPGTVSNCVNNGAIKATSSVAKQITASESGTTTGCTENGSVTVGA